MVHMPKWLRKSFVVIVTILTFGLVAPSQAFLHNQAAPEKSSSRNGQVETEANESQEVARFEVTDEEDESVLDKDLLIRSWLLEAEELSYVKFGSRIKPVIEDEFKQVVLPNIETAIQEVAASYQDEDLTMLEISEKPSGGHSEKIFHIYNRYTNEDVIRFHVRKDRPPQDGYWFNFHYHVAYDNYQTHHDLGSIYWDTNTPPKWMS